MDKESVVLAAFWIMVVALGYMAYKRVADVVKHGYSLQ